MASACASLRRTPSLIPREQGPQLRPSGRAWGNVLKWAALASHLRGCSGQAGKASSALRTAGAQAEPATRLRVPSLNNPTPPTQQTPREVLTYQFCSLCSGPAPAAALRKPCLPGLAARSALARCVPAWQLVPSGDSFELHVLRGECENLWQTTGIKQGVWAKNECARSQWIASWLTFTGVRRGVVLCFACPACTTHLVPPPPLLATAALPDPDRARELPDAARQPAAPGSHPLRPTPCQHLGRHRRFARKPNSEAAEALWRPMPAFSAGLDAHGGPCQPRTFTRTKYSQHGRAQRHAESLIITSVTSPTAPCCASIPMWPNIIFMAVNGKTNSQGVK